MDNRTDGLKRRARGMIVDWAEKVVEHHETGDVMGWELEDFAGELLAILEPVIHEYAPPPSRIVDALRYGNRSPMA